MNRRSNDDGLREYLDEHVSERTPTRAHSAWHTNVHWAWYTDLEEPLHDFSRHEMLTEVEKIRRLKTPRDDAGFRQASDDLVLLAKALDCWYSEDQDTALIATRWRRNDSFGRSR